MDFGNEMMPTHLLPAKIKEFADFSPILSNSFITFLMIMAPMNENELPRAGCDLRPLQISLVQ